MPPKNSSAKKRAKSKRQSAKNANSMVSMHQLAMDMATMPDDERVQLEAVARDHTQAQETLIKASAKLAMNAYRHADGAHKKIDELREHTDEKFEELRDQLTGLLGGEPRVSPAPLRIGDGNAAASSLPLRIANEGSSQAAPPAPPAMQTLQTPLHFGSTEGTNFMAQFNDTGTLVLPEMMQFELYLNKQASMSPVQFKETTEKFLLDVKDLLKRQDPRAIIKLNAPPRYGDDVALAELHVDGPSCKYRDLIGNQGQVVKQLQQLARGFRVRIGIVTNHVGFVFRRRDTGAGAGAGAGGDHVTKFVEEIVNAFNETAVGNASIALAADGNILTLDEQIYSSKSNKKVDADLILVQLPDKNQAKAFMSVAQSQTSNMFSDCRYYSDQKVAKLRSPPAQDDV